MSALPTSLALARTDERWVTVGDLKKAGYPRRSITWQCQAGDLQHCHRFRDNAFGGPKILEINLDAPTCPAKYRQAMQALDRDGDFGEGHALTERQLARATKLAALIQEVDAMLAKPGPFTEGERIDALLAYKHMGDKDIPSSRQSYYRLRKRWVDGGRTLKALADRRAGAGGKVKADFPEEAFTFFASLYLTENRPQASTCYRKLEAMASLQAWEVPSLDTVMRTLRERIPKDRIIEKRLGAKQHHDRTEAYLLRDWSEMKANEVWVADHHILDVIGIDDLPGRARTNQPARMWITSILDEASRYVVGWRIHRGPNASQVLATFFSAIMVHGIPDNARLDNGKEFRCARFAGGRQWREELVKLELDPDALRPLLYDLGITPHYAIPYNARAKIIEPWHRHCLKENYSKFITSGYCGGSAAEKPERLAGNIRHWEKTGEGLLPWTKLVELLDPVIDGYHNSAHEGLGGACPKFVRQQKLSEISLRTADERTAALFLEPRILTCGTFLNIDGAHYGLGNVTLMEHQGEKVKVRLDEMNAGRVYVYEANGRYITTAENAGRIAANATREDVKEGMKRVARHNKLARELADKGPAIHAIDPALALSLQPAPPVEFEGTPNFKPDFTARADDGSRLMTPSTRPALEGSLKLQGNPERMDSPAQPDPNRLPDDLLGLLDG